MRWRGPARLAASALTVWLASCAVPVQEPQPSETPSAVQTHPVAVPVESTAPQAVQVPMPEITPESEAPPSANQLLDQGLASWYGPGLHGRRTASGERFDRFAFTAAHRTLPFGTRVCVRSLVNGRTVMVRINDRGPFAGRDRVVDLSQAAARELGMIGLGIKPVQLWQADEEGTGCTPTLGDDAAQAVAASR